MLQLTDLSTTIITRTVAVAHEEAYASWVQEVNAAAERFPGYQGAIMFAQDAGKQASPITHVLIHRFADQAAYRRWKSSETLARLLEQAAVFSLPHVQTATGLETWFALPGKSTLTPPPRWKMCLATLPAGYLLSGVIVPCVSFCFPGWPFLATNGAVTVLLVAALTYFGMPWTARLFQSWLYPDKGERSWTILSRYLRRS